MELCKEVAGPYYRKNVFNVVETIILNLTVATRVQLYKAN